MKKMVNACNENSKNEFFTRQKEVKYGQKDAINAMKKLEILKWCDGLVSKLSA